MEEGKADDPAQRAGIRRLHGREYWQAGTVAAQLGVHGGTVHAVVEHEPGGVRRGVCRSGAADLYRAFIGDTLAERPHRRAARRDELVRRRGCPGSVVRVHRRVERPRLESGRGVHRRMVILQPAVGRCAFGKARLGHGERPVSGGVMFLGCLRAGNWSAAVENGAHVGAQSGAFAGRERSGGPNGRWERA